MQPQVVIPAVGFLRTSDRVGGQNKKPRSSSPRIGDRVNARTRDYRGTFSAPTAQIWKWRTV